MRPIGTMPSSLYFTRSKVLIIEDLDEAVESSKRSCSIGPNDQGLLERAYTGSIIPRVIGASAKQEKITSRGTFDYIVNRSIP
jgi:hypothetical protein